MTTQVSTTLARLGGRLADAGRRLHELEQRITKVESRKQPNPVVLQRLNRAKSLLKYEMHHYEGLLRTLARS